MIYLIDFNLENIGTEMYVNIKRVLFWISSPLTITPVIVQGSFVLRQ